MIGVALKGLLGRKLRAALTAFAIVLGVAMISGSFVLTDTLSKSFDGIYDESYSDTDAVISSEEATDTADTTSQAPAFSADVLREVEGLPGVRLVQGSIEDSARLVDENGTASETRRGHRRRHRPRRRPEPEPAQARDRPLAQRRRPDCDRQSDRRPPKLRGRTDSRAFGDGPVGRYRVSGIVASARSTRLAARRSPSSTSDRAAPVRQARQARSDPGRRRPGVSETELIGQIEPLLSGTTQVKTATAQASRRQQGHSAGTNILKYFLIGFGGIALFVGSFVIANTLAITVAQRIRELATLRTLGASRHQVLGSVILEAVVIGLIGSIVGLFLGLALAVGLKTLLNATGLELPSSGIVFSTWTIVVSLGVGILIAVLASLRPAFRATRIEPIAAVREGAVLPPSRLARYAVPASPPSPSSRSRCSPMACSPTASTSRSGSSHSSPVCCCCSCGRDGRIAGRAPAGIRPRSPRSTVWRHRRDAGS